MRTFVFPGQGAQALGMGKAVAEAYASAADVFAEVDDALEQKLSGIIWGDDLDTLTLTANAQPALMATSLACWRALQSEGISLQGVSFLAGHSLGEYSALAVAEALSIRDAARLLRVRGEAMQEAVPAGIGAMAALLGLDLETAASIAREAAEDQVCDVANDNDPGQVVISGHKQAVERAVERAKAAGCKRAVMLPVSAPFHCALMQPAAERMAEALAEVSFAAPKVPVVANVRAEAVSDPDTIRSLLVQQIAGSVRWRESVLWMANQGVKEVWEIGPGKALGGMIRRIDREISCRSISTPEEIAALRPSAGESHV